VSGKFNFCSYTSNKKPALAQSVGYDMDKQGPIPGRGRDFFLHHSYTLALAYYPMGTWGSLPRGKVAGT